MTLYIGMSRDTGRAITETDHLRQSVRDILLTPQGSRLARREYGSLLSALIDQPQNPALRLQIMAAVYVALRRWEPRLQLDTITVNSSSMDPPHLHTNTDPAGNGGPRPGRPGRDVCRGGPFFVAEVGACRFADSLTVDDLVADIATIFHWPPSVTDVMPLTEVLEWRHRAIMRSGASDE